MADPVLGLRERKKAKLRQTILDKAIELLREHGYEGLRIADLVDALEISQPTFFRYFPTKEALISAAARQTGDRTRAWMERRHLTPEALERPIRESVQAFSRDVADIALREKRIIAILIRVGLAAPWRQKAQPAAADGSNGWKSSDYPLVIDSILLAAQQRGEVRRDAAIDELGDLYSGAMNQLILRWVSEDPPPYDLHERVERAVDVLLSGMVLQG
jgi:AcrR family transcriptional regulator